MARVAVIDGDAAVRESLASSLRSLGHQTVVVQGVQPGELPGLTSSLDAIVVDVATSGGDRWALLAALRRARPTRTAAIVVYSTSNEVADRIRGLRSGADDWIEKPAAEAELLARLQLALKRRSARRAGLSGGLPAHRLPALLQDLQQARSSGCLEIGTEGEVGKVRLWQGRIVAAEIDRLEGQNALEALMTSSGGTFRFVEGASRSPGSRDSEELSLNDALLDSAWVEEELAARQGFLPPLGDRLELAQRPQVPPAQLPDLPVVLVVNRLASTRARTLADLLRCRLSAPRRVQLLVAWLVEQGIVRVLSESPPAETEPPRAGDREKALRGEG